MSATIRSGYADTASGQLHFRECGEGEPLLLMHPAPRSSRVFTRLLRELGHLGGVRAIAVDLPGFGNSCALETGASMPSIAGTVLQAADSLGLRRLDLFGVHSGNKVAAALAAGFPARVHRCVFAGMTHSLVIDTDRRNAAMRDYVRDKPPADPAEDPAAYRDEQIDVLTAPGNDALYAANFAFDVASALARVQAPSLVIELAVPAEEHLGRQADALCALMPNAQALQLQGDDNEWLQTRPGELARILRSFLLQAGPD